MEIEFDDKPKKGKTPGTRLYSPTKKKAAEEPARSERKKRAQSAPVRESMTYEQDEDGFRIRMNENERINPLARFGIILCGFIFAGMVVFTLSGYERIARSYADVNILNDEIEETQLRIAALDVSIECAVTIQQAQAAAETYGMQYPAKSQYLRPGDHIPVSSTLGGAAPADAGAAEPTEPGAAAPTEPDAGGGDDVYVPPLETEEN